MCKILEIRYSLFTDSVAGSFDIKKLISISPLPVLKLSFFFRIYVAGVLKPQGFKINSIWWWYKN